jgi:hypothetical protein
MRRSFAGCSVAILLGACSDSGSAVTALNNMAAENLTAENLVTGDSIESAPAPAPAPAPVAVPVPAPPRHRYNFKDGDLYGYLGAISEEDQKRGVATPSVVRFRYTGFWQGAHHLLLIADSGSVLEADECAVPCIAIKETYYNGQVRRVGYSPDSIVGAAFEDAINGQLRRSPTPGTISGGYRFKGGDPGDAANWQPISPPAAPAQPNSSTVENLTAENLVVENAF